MTLSRSVVLSAGWLLLVTPSSADEFVISEFMALNSSTLVDSDGDSSDWLEVTNTTAQELDLGGWYLTDNRDELRLWEFPSVLVPGGNRVLVFASGKDRRDPVEMHTSFRLAGDGEYLGLVRPDGTVAHEYAPAYPTQRPDISYGLGQDLIVDPLVADAASARVLVPADNSLGSTWTGGAEPFDDSQWIAGNTGAGYLVSQPGFAVHTYIAATSVGSLATAEDVANNPNLQARVYSANAPFLDFYNTGGTGHYPNNVTFPGLTVGDDANDFVVEATATITIPTAGNWTFGVNSDDGFGLDITGNGASFRIEFPQPRGPGDTLGVFNVPSPGSYDLRLIFYERGGGAELELFAAPGSFSSWGSSFRLIGTATGLAAESQPVGSGEVANVRDFIRTDLQTAMHDVNASAYLRVPFNVVNPAAWKTLTLRMRYDDGFVAHLNGVEIARQNAPAQIAYNSQATADRPATQTIDFALFDVTNHLGLLRTGTNVLAVQGLNDDPASRDFLVLPELAEITVESMAFGYFEEPTPGTANANAFLDFVADTTFDHDRGFYDEPFEVQITTATKGAEIRYTTDGSAPTASTGSVYTDPIPIDRTTTLRAAAFKPGFVATNVDTQTYIFLDDVLTQTGAGFPSSWGGNPSDYEVDPNVVNDPAYSGTIRDDLKSIPTVSIVMHVEDLFGSRGIYSNSTSSGVAWERSGSVELILPEGVDIPGGGDGFQVTCGVRMHGGVGRNPNFYKHSFRFLFKRQYGPTKLNYPLFAGFPQLADGRSTSKFDTLILRAGFNNSWVIGGGQANQAQYLRDQFMRDSLLAVGQPNCHGLFVHLYLNGLYWGVYNFVERPSAPFCAEYFGADKDDWDVLNSGEAIDGDKNTWNQMHSIAEAGLASPPAYQSIQQYLDVTNLIDYMIVNFYGANADWDGHNWYAGRKREVGAGYKFFSWDAERTLEGTSANRVSIDNGGNPSGLYAELRANQEFRVLFGDRAHRHLSAGGALSPAATAARYRLRSEEIDRAIVGESARWGDRTREPPYTRNIEWVRERDRLLNDYFPRRSQILLGQLQSAALYPDVEAPRFSKNGGDVPEGFELLITALDGTTYYTLSGSDPRLEGGGLNPAAQVAGTAETTSLVDATSPVRVLVPQDGSLGLTWTQPGFNDSSWRAGTNGVGYENSSGYETYINTDVQAQMSGVNASVYIRTTFEVDSPVGFLTLRMQYDDGFIAYLNGVPIASRNAPADPQWNSQATGSHSDGSAVVFELIDAESAIDHLQIGTNVLAIHGLNVGTGSSDMLITPQLAVAETSGQGVILTFPTTVKARTLTAGGEWSALAEATFTVDSGPPLRITEMMYHPEPPAANSPYDAEDYEFVEVKNVGTQAVSLAGVQFVFGIQFDFTAGAVSALSPGEHVLIVSNLAAFENRYDTSNLLIAGEYSGQLNNGGEILVLINPGGTPILEFGFSDWYPSTDGAGHSLVIVDENAPRDTWGLQESWRPSEFMGGSPGTDDDGSMQTGGRQLPGDSNQDSIVNIADAVSLLVRLFGDQELPLPCEGTSLSEGGNRMVFDVNGDEGVDVSDVVYLLNFLFQRGAAPVAGTLCIGVPDCVRGCQ